MKEALTAMMFDYITYFARYKSENSDIALLCEISNKVKHDLIDNNYSNDYDHNRIVDCFQQIQRIAIDTDNELLANAQCVFHLYLDFFFTYIRYRTLLQAKQYRESWDILQDCINLANAIGRYVPCEKRYEIPAFLVLLQMYESLYPYKLFGSPEFVFSQSHCSICGKSMQSLDCHHQLEHLYWGQIAQRIIDKVDILQAVAVVTHPADKKCVLEPENIDKNDFFKRLDMFLDMELNPLQQFTIESVIEIRKNTDVQTTGRNDLCPCGSGKKYKRCCAEKLFYRHERNLITPLKNIEMFYL